eukprot:SAG25_NODE_433_length_8083_cov_78.209362_8_plen_126_part_00
MGRSFQWDGLALTPVWRADCSTEVGDPTDQYPNGYHHPLLLPPPCRAVSSVLVLRRLTRYHARPPAAQGVEGLRPPARDGCRMDLAGGERRCDRLLHENGNDQASDDRMCRGGKWNAPMIGMQCR